MEPELQKSDLVDAGSTPEGGVGASTETGGSLSPAGSSPAENAQFQETLDQVYEILSKLPDYIGDFYGKYRQPIVTVALIVVALISVKLVLALLGAINEVPLLAPTFELVGLGYAGWFAYRYLLRVSSRKELAKEFKGLKAQVVGQKPEQS